MTCRPPELTLSESKTFRRTLVKAKHSKIHFFQKILLILSSFRQTLNCHKLDVDKRGQLLFLLEFLKNFGCGISGSFYLSLSFSRTQVVTEMVIKWQLFCSKKKYEWKLCHFEQNKLSFDDFLMTTWEQENESERKKEPQILRLDLCSQWDEIFLKGNSCFHWIFTKHLFQYSIRIEEISHQWKRM